mgnify:CR=1 FL=1
MTGVNGLRFSAGRAGTTSYQTTTGKAKQLQRKTRPTGPFAGRDPFVSPRRDGPLAALALSGSLKKTQLACACATFGTLGNTWGPAAVAWCRQGSGPSGGLGPAGQRSGLRQAVGGQGCARA